MIIGGEGLRLGGFRAAGQVEVVMSNRFLLGLYSVFGELRNGWGSG